MKYNIEKFGAVFKGGIYPVNPNYPEIEVIQCYPSVAEVPESVDIAIVFVQG